LSQPFGDRAGLGLPGPFELQASAAPPPLQLSHAVSPPEEASAESEEVTVFGA
jgi:hypothetical protein